MARSQFQRQHISKELVEYGFEKARGLVPGSLGTHERIREI